MNKQKEIEAWLIALERYGKENEFSARIMDRIAECIEDAGKGHMDMELLRQKINELLESIDYKVGEAAVINKEETKAVPKEKVMQKIREFAGRTRNEIESSIEELQEQRKTITKKTYDDMMDITKTRAHLDDLKNDDYYLQFFNTQKENYERQATPLCKGFVSDMTEHYGKFMEHVKGIFMELQGQSGFSSRKFYSDYSVNRDKLEHRIQNQVDATDIGGDDLLSFGKRTQKPIRKMVKKQNNHFKFFACLPIFIILLVPLTNITVSLINDREPIMQSSKNEEQDADVNSTEDSQEQLKETYAELKENQELIMDAIDELKEGNDNTSVTTPETRVLKIAGGTISVIWLVAFLMVAIIIYIAYVKMLRKVFDNNIAKKCGAYLITECNKFRQEDTLGGKLEETMRNLMEEYERQYLSMFDSVFQQTKYSDTSMDEYRNLKAQWNDLQRI